MAEDSSNSTDPAGPEKAEGGLDDFFSDTPLLSDDDGRDTDIEFFSEPESGYAVDPVPSVDHFVGGKRVSGGIIKKLVPGFLILLFCSAIVLFVFKLLKSGSGLPGPDPTVFEKELQNGRVVVIQSKALQTYAPSLYRDRVVRGLDLELFDNGKLVSPDRYSIEFSNDDLYPVLILDVRSRNPRLLKKLEKTLILFHRMRITREGQPIRKRWRIFLRSAKGLNPLSAKLLGRPGVLSGFVRRSPRPAGGKKLLLNLIRGLASKPRHFQIIYLTDRIFKEGDGPEPVSLYRFLKKNRRFQFYRMDLSGTPHSVRDQFSYLSKNSVDYKQPAHAFCDYRFPGEPDSVFSLFTRQIALSPPLRKITLLYRPEKKDKAGEKRKLGIRLRFDREDSSLSVLSSSQYIPNSYSYYYPDKAPGGKLKLSGGKQAFFSSGDYLLRLKDSCTNIQYTAAKIINAAGGEIKAVSASGLFLFRIPGRHPAPFSPEKLIRTAGIADDHVLFLNRHPWFVRAWSAITNRNFSEPVSPWHEQYWPRDDSAISSVKNDAALFLFFPGAVALDDQGLKPQEAVVVGDGAGAHADDAARLLASLIARGGLSSCPAVYRVITSTRYSDKYRARPFVSGFEVYSALEYLAAVSKKKKTVSCFDTSAVHPAVWEKHSKKAARAVQELIRRISSAGSWITAPVNGLPALYTSEKRMLFAAPVRRSGGKTQLQDPGRLCGIRGLQVFPMPGIGLYDKRTGLGGSGGALAAALLVPPVWNADASFSGEPHFEPVSALQDGVERTGLGFSVSLYNRGIICRRKLSPLLKNRRDFLKTRLILSNLRSDAYRHVNSLLGGQWHNNPQQTTLTALASGISGSFFKTYQFFDRSSCVTGFTGGNALYDVYTPFSLSPRERRELALVSHRGLVFLLCTRNRHRGWILNTGTPLAGRGIAFDPARSLVILSTRRGELLFTDARRGRFLQTVLRDEKGQRLASGLSLKTDHTLHGADLLIDPAHNNLWIYGRGTGYVNLLSYKRIKDTVVCTFSRAKDCNDRPLFSDPGAIRISPSPVLFPSGTVNLILREKQGKAVYIRIDRDGHYF